MLFIIKNPSFTNFDYIIIINVFKVKEKYRDGSLENGQLNPFSNLKSDIPKFHNFI